MLEESSGSTPLVPMVEATNFGDLDHPSATDFLDFAMLGAVHCEREMRARVVIVVEVVADHSPQMPLIQDDDVIEALPPDRSDHAFDEWILPWTSRSNQHFLEAHVSDSFLKSSAIDLVPVAKQILGLQFPRERFHDLLRRPLCGRVGGDVEVQVLRRVPNGADSVLALHLT